MSHASDNILDSVVLITQTDSKKFGTGFAIHTAQGDTWIVTCAHVVEGVGDTGQMLVDDKPAEVLFCGHSKGVDLAVLKVQGSDIPPLKLRLAGQKEMPCVIAGFAKLTSELRRATPLEGVLGSRAVLKAPGRPRVSAWRLLMEDKTLLQEGYSGSPVICAATGAVFAVASHEEHQGERGYAVSLTHLQDVWPELPAELLSTQPQTGGWLSREQRELLENLFQDLPVSEPRLRDLCHQTMPPNAPHEIPAEANHLDLLEWLVERGQLAEGQVPLLSVLRELLPRIRDTEAHAGLKQCITQIARHYGITDLQDMPESMPAKAEEVPALMLQIWPIAAKSKHCNVQGHLFYSSARCFSIYVREKENALLWDDEASLTDLVEDLRELLVKRGVREKAVIVEFILPRELLSEPVEQWTDEVGDPLGTYLPVVVRSRERLQDCKLQLGWQSCWNILLAHQRKRLPDSLWWFEFEENQRRQVRRKLQEGVFTVLCFVPDLLASPRQNAVFYLLHKGTPAMLWPRQGDSLTDFARELQTFLKDKSLSALPEIIRAMRQALWENEKETAPCYHLTLLWDDPNRRPPRPENDDEFLQAPV